MLIASFPLINHCCIAHVFLTAFPIIIILVAQLSDYALLNYAIIKRLYDYKSLNKLLLVAGYHIFVTSFPNINRCIPNCLLRIPKILLLHSHSIPYTFLMNFPQFIAASNIFNAAFSIVYHCIRWFLGIVASPIIYCNFPHYCLLLHFFLSVFPNICRCILHCLWLFFPFFISSFHIVNNLISVD